MPSDNHPHAILMLSDLKLDPFLNEQAANASGLPYGEKFTMENFTYSNNVIATTMFKHLNRTNFQGITVSYHTYFTYHTACDPTQ